MPEPVLEALSHGMDDVTREKRNAEEAPEEAAKEEWEDYDAEDDDEEEAGDYGMAFQYRYMQWQIALE